MRIVFGLNSFSCSMAAAGQQSDDAAEVLWLAKLTNSKSVNSEASSVLSIARNVAGCTIPATSSLALLQRTLCGALEIACHFTIAATGVNASKPKSKSSDENKAIKTLLHLVFTASLSQNIGAQQVFARCRSPCKTQPDKLNEPYRAYWTRFTMRAAMQNIDMYSQLWSSFAVSPG